MTVATPHPSFRNFTKRSAPAPGGSGTLTRHSGSLCSDSGRGYPESPPSKPQTDNFRDVMHGTKEGDSGYFLPLLYRKFRNDGLNESIDASTL